MREPCFSTPLATRLLVLLVGFAAGFVGGSLGVAGENAAMEAARRSITVGELQAHAEVLADDALEGREAGSRGGQAAARYIVERMEEAGLVPMGLHGEYTQRFRGSMQNLLGAYRGASPELRDEWIVIGAHYDHVGYGTRRNSFGPIGYIHNGADDNASGVAVALEVADALSRLDEPPARSILFAFWDGEEKGLYGSKHWGRQPTVPMQSVRLAVNIDMVGHLTDGKLLVGGTRTGLGLRRLWSTEQMPGGLRADFTWEYADNSDHWTFYQARVPSMILHTGLHDYYHRPTDDVERLNVPGMRSVADYLFDRVLAAADAEELPRFRSSAGRENEWAQKRAESLLPKMGSRAGVRCSADPAGGARVISITGGSAASKAGVQIGDRVVAVNGLPADSPILVDAVAWMAESKMVLTVVRGDAEPADFRLRLPGRPVRLGLSWRSDPADPSEVFVTRVVPGTPADRAGVQLLDRLREVDGVAVTGQGPLLKHVGTLLDAGVSRFPVTIERGGALRELEVAMTLPTGGEGDASL